MAGSTACSWTGSAEDVLGGWMPASSGFFEAEEGNSPCAAGSAGGSGFDADFSIDLDGQHHRGTSNPNIVRRRTTRAALNDDEESCPFLEPGQRIAGFRILRELGRGAFARVYLAEQGDLAGRRVALKVAQALGDEPEALARLQHTHIVPIHSVHDDPKSGLRLLCMPYYGGANLAQVLESSGARMPSLATGRSLVEALDRVGGKDPTNPGLRLGAAATRGIGSPSHVRSLWGRHWTRLPWWRKLEGSPRAAGRPARR